MYPEYINNSSKWAKILIETSPVKIREMEIFHIQGSNWDVISRKKKVLQFSLSQRAYYFHPYRNLKIIHQYICFLNRNT